MATKAFRFRLERVRELRQRVEDEAKEELARSMTERARWAERADLASAQARSAFAAQRSSIGTGLDVPAILAHQAFVDRADREQHAAEMDLSRQDAEVQARRGALAEAARERQVLEKLKQRQAALHRREAERREAAHIDELALAMHRRRDAR